MAHHNKGLMDVLEGHSCVLVGSPVIPILLMLLIICLGESRTILFGGWLTSQMLHLKMKHVIQCESY